MPNSNFRSPAQQNEQAAISIEPHHRVALSLLIGFSTPVSPQALLREFPESDRPCAERLIAEWTQRGVLVEPGQRLPRLEVLPRDLAEEKEFLGIHSQCRQFGSTSPALNFALYQALDYLHEHDIAGDIAETGVWKGGSMIFCALALLAKRNTTRSLYLYDPFDLSWPEPREVDSSRYGSTYESRKKDHDDQVRARMDDPARAKRRAEEFYHQVRENVLSTGYPADKIVFVKGYVEQTLPATIPEKVALLRLDTDWHESTRHCLEHLYPRLVAGGVLLIDDYPTENGATRAVDEFFCRKWRPDFPGPDRLAGSHRHQTRFENLIARARRPARPTPGSARVSTPGGAQRGRAGAPVGRGVGPGRICFVTEAWRVSTGAGGRA